MAAPLCLIGIDLGTSACKALAIDGAGQVLAQASAGYPLATPQPGWAEQAPADWQGGADRAMRELVAALPASAEVAAIGLSGQMHGLVALDDADAVIRPAILWCDNRTGPQCEALTARLGGIEAMVALTRNRMLPGFTGGKFLWLQEHEPRTLERMRRFLLPKDMLRLDMTGDYATDVSDASGTGLFDVSARRWSQPMVEAVGLSADQLPAAWESHEVTGRLRPAMAERWGLRPGVPVVAGGGDSVIQTVSMGAIDPGMIGITLGTAGLIGASAAICPDNPGALLQVSCSNAPGRWHVMGVSLNGGGAFQWWRDAVAAVPGGMPTFDALVGMAAEVAPGAGSLLFLPFLLGERCPHVAPDGRGAWIGLTHGHDIRHMTRAVMEGIALNLRSILALIAGAGVDCSNLRASGGATASRAWLQLLADVTGRPVGTPIAAAEGGAFGAALLAGVGAGHWTSLEEAVSTIRLREVVAPSPDAVRIYDRLHPIHEALYEALRPSTERLAGLRL
jgi:xylulokinase